jgi:CheY-like chemotaxis protein
MGYHEVKEKGYSMNRSKRIVLYVSDNKFMHIVIKDTLRPYNITVIDVYDAQSALKSLKDTSPDLILTDIDMPGMDGFELCKQIRAFKPRVSAAVVIYSGSENPEDIERAFLSGAKGYIVKKYHKEVLAEKIIHYLR